MEFLSCSPLRRIVSRLFLPAVVTLSSVVCCRPVEKPGGTTLEQYLGRLAYEPIPLRRDNQNHLVVSGHLNKRKRMFLVDTGWSMTAVDKSTARRIKTLGDLGVRIEDDFLGTLSDPSTVLMEEIALGRAKFLNQPARLMDLGGAAKGNVVLGCDFLYRNHCLIDCLGQRLYVRGTKPSAQTESALGETLERSGFHMARLNPKLNLVMTCNAEANGLPVKLLLDTGGQFTVFDHSQTRRLGLTPLDTGASLRGAGKIGAHPLRVSILQTLHVGGLTVTNFPVGVAELKNWGIAERGSGLVDVQGVLGAEFLAENNALIECRRLRLWLRPTR